jgi:hypothetical protein
MKAALATAAAILALAGLTGQAVAHTRPPVEPDAARGLVYRGLRPATTNGPCETAFELRLPRGRLGCSHGPDAAPPGVDVRQRRTLAELAASTQAPAAVAAGTASSVQCIGDGQSGNRVQAVYAYPAGGTDKYRETAPYIRRWAAVVDTVFNDSAAQTGGVRHVRYVTRPDCTPDVAKVALSESGVESLAGTAADLAAHGFDRADRRYLVWVDEYRYCGLATVQPDDRPTGDNANNGGTRPGFVARIDRGCWGGVEPSIEAHELVHLLGGIQQSAPNADDDFHCTDEADVMCYDDDGVLDGQVWADGKLVPLRSVCPADHERLLDCGNDDYFSTAPAAGSYLEDHWNVADSSFLDATGPASVADSVAPRPTGPKPRVTGGVGRGLVQVRLSWSCRDDDAVGYWLWQSIDGGAWKYVPTPNAGARSVSLQLRRGHRYRFLVHAYDAAGNASPAAFGPAFRVRLLEERNPGIAYGGRWQRRQSSFASAYHLTNALGRRASARLAFSGRAVAWVSRLSQLGGRAWIFVDGRYAGTVRLAAPAATPRAVVFSRRWALAGRHVITIRRVGARAVPLDAFIVLG